MGKVKKLICKDVKNLQNYDFVYEIIDLSLNKPSFQRGLLC